MGLTLHEKGTSSCSSSQDLQVTIACCCCSGHALGCHSVHLRPVAALKLEISYPQEQASTIGAFGIFCLHRQPAT